MRRYEAGPANQDLSEAELQEPQPDPSCCCRDIEDGSMADDLSKRRPQNRTRIHHSEDRNVRYRTKAFGSAKERHAGLCNPHVNSTAALRAALGEAA
jgi:hypothetical protein